MLGIKRKAISVLVVTALFISIPSVLGKFTILNIPNVDVNTNTSSKKNIETEETQEIFQINELPAVKEIINIPPVISEPADIEYYYGQTGNVIIWIITDDSIDPFNVNYIVTADGDIISQGKWISGKPISVPVDGLLIGPHDVIITAYDGLGGESSDIVVVKVLNIPPVINQPEDIQYNYGQTGNEIIWIITDDSVDALHTQYVVIEVDGNEIDFGPWISGLPVSVNVDGLLIGPHNIKITAYDGYGGEVSDFVEVTVLNGAPIITHPNDIEYDYGQTGNEIIWTITDDSTDPLKIYYIVTDDGSQIGQGPWISGIPFSVNVDGLSIGTHDIIITADDGYGGIVWDNVSVIVLNVAPIISQPDDIEYDYGQTGNEIIWTITDESIDALHTNYVVIEVDGQQIQTGTWRSDSIIEVNVDGLSIGTHEIKITADDGYGGVTSDSVNVVVNDISDMYEYIDMKFEELEAYIDENLFWLVKWIVGYTVGASHHCIEKAYEMYESGHLCAGTMYSYFSQALLYFTDIELEIFSYFSLISDEDKAYINDATAELRNCITILRDIYI